MAVYRVQLVSVSCNRMPYRQLPRNWLVSVFQVKVRRPLLCCNPSPLSVPAAIVRHNSNSWQIQRSILFWALSKVCSRAQVALSKPHKDVNHLKRLMLGILSHCSSSKSLSNNPQQHPSRQSCCSNCKQCWISRVLVCSPNLRIYRQKNNKGQWAHSRAKVYLKIGYNYSYPNFQRILRVPARMSLRINEFQAANQIMTRNN